MLASTVAEKDHNTISPEHSGLSIRVATYMLHHPVWIFIGTGVGLVGYAVSIGLLFVTGIPEDVFDDVSISSRLLIGVTIFGFVMVSWWIWVLVVLRAHRVPGARFSLNVAGLSCVLVMTPVLVMYVLLPLGQRGWESRFDTYVPNQIMQDVSGQYVDDVRWRYASHCVAGQHALSAPVAPASCVRLLDRLRQSDVFSSGVSAVRCTPVGDEHPSVAQRWHGDILINLDTLPPLYTDPTDTPHMPYVMPLVDQNGHTRYTAACHMFWEEAHVHIETFTPLKEHEQSVLIGIDQLQNSFATLADAPDLLNDFQAILWLVSSPTILLSMILAILLARRVTRPVEQMLHGTRVISQGSIGYTIPHVRYSDTEMRRLLEAFNHMSSRLAESRDQLYQVENSPHGAKSLAD